MSSTTSRSQWTVEADARRTRDEVALQRERRAQGRDRLLEVAETELDRAQVYCPSTLVGSHSTARGNSRAASPVAAEGP